MSMSWEVTLAKAQPHKRIQSAVNSVTKATPTDIDFYMTHLFNFQNNPTRKNCLGKYLRPQELGKLPKEHVTEEVGLSPRESGCSPPLATCPATYQSVTLAQKQLTTHRQTNKGCC
jgi:hypothetical protein